MTSPAPAAPTTSGSAWKIVASVVVVAGAVAFLLSRSLKEGAESYKHVDEVMANVTSMHGKRLQAVISANYTGLVPDTFKSGAEVVARGMLGDNERLDVIPDGIMAKCPSK